LVTVLYVIFGSFATRQKDGSLDALKLQHELRKLDHIFDTNGCLLHVLNIHVRFLYGKGFQPSEAGSL